MSPRIVLCFSRYDLHLLLIVQITLIWSGIDVIQSFICFVPFSFNLHSASMWVFQDSFS